MVRKKFLPIAAAAAGVLVLAGGIIALRGISSRRAEYRFSPGERLIYQVRYLSRLKADFQTLFEDLKNAPEQNVRVGPGITQSIETSVEGKLNLTVLEKREDGFTLACRFDYPTVSLLSNGRKAELEEEIISTSLSLETFADIGADGKIRSLYFDPQADENALGYVRALMAMMQVVLPKGQKFPRRWETEEDDPSGTAVVRYQLSSGRKFLGFLRSGRARFMTLRKIKTRYKENPETIVGASKTLPRNTIPDAAWDVSFDARMGRVHSIQGQEKQRVFISGKEVSSADSSFEMTFLTEEKLPADEFSAMKTAAADLQKTVPAASLRAEISKAESEALIQKSELGRASVETLLADLERAEARGDKENQDLYLKLKALVYLQPETCNKLAARLAMAPPKSLSFDIISGALAVVGHEQAQAAIVEVIRSRRNDPEVVRPLVQALGLAGNAPTMLAQSELQELAFQSQDEKLASVSLLALGGEAKALAGTDASRAADIVRRLIDGIRTTTPDKKMAFLLALGNSGSDLALDTFVRYLKDNAAELRAAAADGLRWLSPGEADVHLRRVLLEDPEPSVRTEAAFALSFRKPDADTFQATKRVFLNDRSVPVRLSALKNLWEMRELFPEVNALAKTAAAQDPSEDVRKAASRLLGLPLNTDKK
jgi:hypothetical protein